MSTRQVLILIGIGIVAFLFLGLPPAWDKAFAIAAGLVVVFIAYSLPAETMRRGARSSSERPGRAHFVEHRNEPAPSASSVPSARPAASSQQASPEKITDIISDNAAAR